MAKIRGKETKTILTPLCKLAQIDAENGGYMVDDILIKNGMILTMEDDEPVIENGTLLIEDGVITGIGKAELFLQNSAAQMIDATGSIVMPGLVNCHTHLPMSLFRGLADDLPLEIWLSKHIFPAEAEQINPDSVKKWALHSCHELLFSGTTTCCDGYFYEDLVAKAVLESGLRAVTGHGVIDFPAPGVPDPEKNVETAVNFAKKWKNRSSCIHPSIFCHSPYTCSKATLKKAKQAADSLGILFQIHVAETENEQNMIQENKDKSPVEYLDSLELLDEHTLLSHAVWINENDIAIIKKRGASIAHCAESNMKLAAGIAPIPLIMENEIIVGLGTDGSASNNNLDLFLEMDTAAKLHKIACSDPCVMNAKDVVKMATIGGAKALGLGKSIGSLKIGKKADIIIINTEKPHLVPLYNPFSTLVYGVKGSDVTHVIVDGEILCRP